jgi:predicted ester cyclase
MATRDHEETVDAAVERIRAAVPTAVPAAVPVGVTELAGRPLPGLDVRSRTVSGLLSTRDVHVLRARTEASRSDGAVLGWEETHLLRTSGGVVVDEFAEVPVARVAAFAAGAGVVWQPPRRPSTAVGAVGLRAAMRLAVRGSSEDPLEVVARYVEEFKNRRRFTVFPRLFGPGFRHHFGFPDRDDRLATFMDVGRSVLGAFADLRVHVDDLVADGETVVERNHVEARHVGGLAGERATGRRVRWTEIHVYRVVEGRIVENWPAVDVETVAVDVGALPPPVRAGGPSVTAP